MAEYTHISHTFSPVYDCESKILILGSLPSVKSREEGFYYGHPRNRFCKAQWGDFDYKLSDGESLYEVQVRNIKALESVLKEYKDKTIVVGSHGTALSTIINYYDKSFGYEEFEKIRSLMPWIVKFVFDDEKCIEIKKYNLF